MALRDWISESRGVATATLATVATLEESSTPTVAGVATVAVAKRQKDENKALTVATVATVAVATVENQKNIHDEPLNILGRKRDNRQPSPIALEWLLEHRRALLDAGWTLSELFDRRRYRQGLAFLGLWEEAFSQAYLHENGEIEFELSRHGRDYFQRSRPRAMAPAKQTAEINSGFSNQF